MNKQAISDSIWITVAVIAIILRDVLQAKLPTWAFVLIMAVAAAQIVLGLVINPLVRHFLKKRRDRLDRNLARVLLGVAPKQ